MKRIILLIFFFFSLHSLCLGNLSVHSTIGDSMVLQRHQPILLKGYGSAGRHVAVEFINRKLETVVGDDELWEMILPPQEAGGPYELTITSGNETLSFVDVYIGDVWLASGQSNMGYKVGQGVLDTEQEIASANFPLIRHLKIKETAANRPLGDIQTDGWTVCCPENVKDFSAVAYFFARKVHLETGIPIGIIHASWGGSSIEAWTASEVLKSLPHSKGPSIPEIEKGEMSLLEFNTVNQSRIDRVLDLVDNSFDGLSQGVHQVEFDDADWRQSPLPGWADFDREIYWMRKSFELSEHPSKGWTLNLGYSSHRITVYLNGYEVFNGTNVNCCFELPPEYLKVGSNLIALRLANPWWPPYLNPKDTIASLETADASVRLEFGENWKVSSNVEPQFEEFHTLQEIPAGCFNAMIHPLLDTRIKGVIWYQGENNGSRGIEYRALFPSMISDWRIRFQQGYFPFIWVQLANNGNPALVENTGWPFLREAQDLTLHLPSTGMATAIDVGEAMDIHPKNKQDVGLRLALNALKIAYSHDIPFSGPRLKQAQFSGGKVVLSFHHAKGLHTKHGNRPLGFVIAGEDKVFYEAEAEINGEDIVLSSSKVDYPVAVRYAWAKNPNVNLYNSAALPACPFRTDDWLPDR